MSTKVSPKNPPHHGRNVRRLRELLNKKQELLADEIEVTQSTMSKIERQAKINDKTLEKIATALDIPVEAIKNLTDEAANNMVTNSFSDFKDNAIGTGAMIGEQNNQTFNAIEKFIEIYDHIMAEKGERAKLFEKIDSLEKKLGEKK